MIPPMLVSLRCHGIVLHSSYVATMSADERSSGALAKLPMLKGEKRDLGTEPQKEKEARRRPDSDVQENKSTLTQVNNLHLHRKKNKTKTKQTITH